MEYIRITKDNPEKEHICCAISNNKDVQVSSKNAPTPITNYALFHDGEYVTNEQMNDKKFLKLVNG